METIFMVVLALLAGVAVGWLIARSRINAQAVQCAVLEKEQTRLSETTDEQARTISTLSEEKTALTAKREVLSSQVDALQSQLADLKKQHEQELVRDKDAHTAELAATKEGFDKQIEELKKQIENERNYAKEMIEAANERLKKEQEHAAQLREESERQWTQKLDNLKQEMQKTAMEQLASKQAALQESNRQQWNELLQPIKEQFADFKKSFNENKNITELSKKELQHSFEATLRLFRQEQEQTVKALSEQTMRIGSDAVKLTKALKGEAKIQGDWGEMILESLLEQSGLRKNEEYFIQKNVKNEEGKNYRPDVIVQLPEDRAIVIDSKVSLTAYTDALSTDDDALRDSLLKAHAQSVRRHIDELATKDYSKLVDNAIGYVLMFIPNESSYIAAMQQQPDLGNYAYRRHIIMIPPTNLMMALQLAYNLWQYDRQNKNVEQIFKVAKDLYEKVAGFSDSFYDVDVAIQTLTKKFGEAKNRLYEGKGNVMRRIEGLKDLGVTTERKIKSLEDISA